MTSKPPNITEIKTDVIRKVGNPVNVMVVKATLESFGLREKDVYQDYGFNSLKEMADNIYSELKSGDNRKLINEEERKNLEKSDTLIPVSSYLWMKAKLLLQYYPLGLFHLLPIFLQIGAIIIFGYSLWAYLQFNIVQSTAVILGVILGLIMSGGYVQVIGKQASFYWHHGEYLQAKLVIDLLIIAGIKGLGISMILMGILNLLFQIYSISFLAVMFTYSFLIGLLLLLTASYHIFKQRWVISVVIFLATVIGVVLKEFTSMHIYFTHWISLIAAIIMFKIYLEHFFNKHYKAKRNAKLRIKTPFIIYKNYQYFLYGALIYIFIFLDRLIAWSADYGRPHDFTFLYEKNYEIGMDLAILIFFLLAGVMEYALASFSKFLDLRQKTIPFIKTRKFNKSFGRMYLNHVILMFFTATGSAILLYLIISQPWGYEAGFGDQIKTLSVKVCIIGAIGYFFLSWGMLNSLYLFTLNQAKTPVKAIAIAFLINLLVGYLASRGIGYEYSVLGMLAGSIVFMLLTTNRCIHFFKNIDYYYYAAI